MSDDAKWTNRKPFPFAIHKEIIADQKLHIHDSESTGDRKTRLLESINFPYHRRLLQEKSAKEQHGGVRKQKSNIRKRRGTSVGRATVPITPQMIHVAVKELQTRRVYISSSLIASHLQRCYPIENDQRALKEELNEKLNCAVSVGLIAKCGDDKYCIPTLRQQASSNKTALTAFWDTYYRRRVPSMMERLFTLRIPRVRTYKRRTSVALRRSCHHRSENYQEFKESDN